jgi:aminoglycoside phosphotransferase (APT) family kinase protein
LVNVSHLRKRAMYESMLDTLARLHSVDVDEAGLGDYGARAGNASTVTVTVQPGACCNV